MILPIVAYGDPVLRKVCTNIDSEYPKLKELIDNMFQTMYHSNGVGLAAPQIVLPIRLFVIDAKPFSDDDDLERDEQELLKNFKKVFINAKILKEEGEKWTFNEGCLSIPGVTEDVGRQEFVTIEYQDEDFNTYTETFSGLAARIIQHEYDHLEGILFIDRISEKDRDALIEKFSKQQERKKQREAKKRHQS